MAYVNGVAFAITIAAFTAEHYGILRFVLPGNCKFHTCDFLDVLLKELCVAPVLAVIYNSGGWRDVERLASCCLYFLWAWNNVEVCFG